MKAIEKDPATAYSRSKNEKLQELGKQYMELESGMELLHKAYIRGLGEMKQPVPSYPDANFTMRLTYGNVKSYSPRDAVHYDYYTTTDGILEKRIPKTVNSCTRQAERTDSKERLRTLRHGRRHHAGLLPHDERHHRR